MIILDVNILIYANNAGLPQHAATRKWLEELLDGHEGIGVPWITAWAFLRLTTNKRIFPAPFSVAEASAILREVMAHPRVRMIDPGPRHLDLLEQTAIEGQVSGPMMTDATLAALCLEQGATMASTDRGFARY